MNKQFQEHWEYNMEKILNATHEGILTINEFKIKSYVLENGVRVLNRIEFIRAIGRTGKAKGGRGYDREFKVPVFLSANNLRPFIDNELLQNSKPIIFKDAKGAKSIGYKAELLPSVCNVFLDAHDKNALSENQLHIADRCKILIRGLATVGIIALVDEATGYQEIRDKKALQQILDKYLLKEYAKWAKRFPDEFYIEMFRLKGWQWKGMKINRPSVVGKYTNDIVYSRLAPGLLSELKRLNPPNEQGQRKTKHTQWLTEQIGHPALQQHLYAIVSFMRTSNTWGQFQRMVERAFPKLGDTIPMNLDE